MKAKILFCIFLLMAVSVNRIVAQDTVRQGEWAENFPVDDESVEWQQNVYRELFLTEGSNVGLFSPADQEGATTGLFACLFNIAMKDNINLYKYDIDGIEKLTKNSRVNIKDIFDDYHFPYKEDSLGNITFDKNDIPYADVKIFYLKEAMYYDISNSSFHKKVIALCPVLVLQDDFSGEPVRYPLFWTKYEEVEKYLHNIMIQQGKYNMTKRMSMADYFSLNLYTGKIYKTDNPHVTTLSQDCENDSTLERIEQYYDDTRKAIYNPYYGKKQEGDNN